MTYVKPGAETLGLLHDRHKDFLEPISQSNIALERTCSANVKSLMNQHYGLKTRDRLRKKYEQKYGEKTNSEIQLANEIESIDFDKIIEKSKNNWTKGVRSTLNQCGLIEYNQSSQSKPMS